MTATIDGGEFKATVGGTSKCAALKPDKGSTDLKVKGGKITGDISGVAGKIINCAGNIKISGGTIDVTATGTDAEIIVSDKKIEISDGSITLHGSEDCINAAGDITISGGEIYCESTGGDGIDSNGNITISGGKVICYTTAVEEDNAGSTGLDVNSGYTMTISGGVVVALGGPNSTFHGVTGSDIFLADMSNAQLNGAEYSGKTLTIGGEEITLPEITAESISLLYYPYAVHTPKAMRLLVK